MPAKVLAGKLDAVAEPATECRIFEKCHNCISKVFRIIGDEKCLSMFSTNRRRRSRSGNDWFACGECLQQFVLDALSNAKRRNYGGTVGQIHFDVGDGASHNNARQLSQFVYSVGGIAADDQKI